MLSYLKVITEKNTPQKSIYGNGIVLQLQEYKSS
jgi:hypothetical protein